ncbi:unnamed protein product, partial [Ixodes hexagonus]
SQCSFRSRIFFLCLSISSWCCLISFSCWWISSSSMSNHMAPTSLRKYSSSRAASILPKVPPASRMLPPLPPPYPLPHSPDCDWLDRTPLKRKIKFLAARTLCCSAIFVLMRAEPR